MASKKLIFLDIDGTITMPGIPPSAETVSAIRAARENGHLVFLSTGRAPFSVAKEVAEIGYDGGIYFAGGQALLRGECIMDCPLSSDQALALIEEISDLGLVLHLEAAHHMYTAGDDKNLNIGRISDASSELLRRMMQFRDSQSLPLSSYSGEPIYKIGIVSYCQQQREELFKRLPQWAKLVWFDNFHSNTTVVAGEISHFAVTKGLAMEKIANQLGCSTEDCIAFGDSMNDAEILKSAGIGVAMGNSTPELKEVADQVCDPCQENGIAKAFKRIKLI